MAWYGGNAEPAYTMLLISRLRRGAVPFAEVARFDHVHRREGTVAPVPARNKPGSTVRLSQPAQTEQQGLHRLMLELVNILLLKKDLLLKKAGERPPL